MRRLKRKFRHALNVTALGATGAALTLAGAGFLVAAAHTLLSALTDPLTATLFMGCALLGSGLLLLAFVVKPLSDHDETTPEREAPAPDELVAAFLNGLDRGLAQGRRR